MLNNRKGEGEKQLLTFARLRFFPISLSVCFANLAVCVAHCVKGFGQQESIRFKSCPTTYDTEDGRHMNGGNFFIRNVLIIRECFSVKQNKLKEKGAE
jgi:hypothetical protein